jgi:hypothetical protein
MFIVSLSALQLAGAPLVGYLGALELPALIVTAGSEAGRIVQEAGTENCVETVDGELRGPCEIGF